MFFLLVLLFLGLMSDIGLAAQQPENRTRLEEIRKRIEQTSQTLAKQQQQEVSLLHDLAVINTSLREIERRISALKAEQRRGRKQIAKTQVAIDQGTETLHQQQKRLQKRLIALYKEGETGVLKILFSSNSPGEFAQQYVYLSRILAHDKILMDDFRTSLAAQQQRLTHLEALQQQQQQRLDAEQAEREDARRARRLQAQVLSKVRQDQNRLQDELQNLKEKAQRLTTLISQLQERKTRVGKSFSAQKGQLPWPVKGALLVGFGTQKNQHLGTLYESHGIEIAARPGEKIYAVAAGKVVYASWFKGYGNLVILAHEGGYHSLYAQAGQVLKKTGDLVSAHELLATAADQGLYFELRSHGAPLNPLGWLEKR
ncbi:MAG: peptidoglycan DD-metalloendopeptidase family protein [Deltaproteobacteria bacterium]|nr:peptidoglycan DD-metalloendopeptidase family protein [Deltaproteobacteria bacterium]